MKTFFLSLVFLTAGLQHAMAKKQPHVIAYYTGTAETLAQYPIGGLSHVIYSFLHLKGDSLSFDSPAQQENLRKIVALKASHPGLKIMISMGGWTGCYSCSPVFSTAEGRQNFANSVLDILKTNQLDGIDLDWEYPAIAGAPGHPYLPTDRDNFTDLIVRLRKTLGRRYELSFAAGGFTSFLENSIDWKAVAPLVNYINLMTYDLISGYSIETGHHTALYSRPEQVESTDRCVQWLLAHGLPAKKLIIGAAFYARIWENVAPKNNGLYQSGKFKAGVDYKEFSKRLSPDSGWVYYWDDTAKATHAYHPANREFATFDDDRSLSEKVAYARQYKLGGIMFWELMNDPFTNGRLQSIYNAVKK